MQKMFMGALLSGCMVLSAAAAAEADAESVCERLEDAIEAEIDALESVKDAESAQSAIADVQKALDAQKALFGVDEYELWNYIEHTGNVKEVLMRCLQRLAAEIDRLEKVKFYGNTELRALVI